MIHVHVIHWKRRERYQFLSGLAWALVSSSFLGRLGYHALEVIPMGVLVALCWLQFCNNRWPIFEIVSVEKDDE